MSADDSTTRITNGTIGVGTMGPGSKSFDDLSLNVPVPKPGSVAMLMVGTWMLGVLGHRRRMRGSRRGLR
ncbi:MAG TPA: hypothetical protein EYQ60_02940 [Myxococcales bacterium]|nr:hypothetical protein [Myxococcales bacterium]